MSLVTPTVNDISDNIVSQLEATLNQNISLLPTSFIRVLAKALAGVYITLYKYAGYNYLQQFVATAQNENTIINGVVVNPLVFWGRLFGVGDPTSATSAELEISITVNNQVGSIPSGSQLLNTSNGVTYVTVGAILLDAATVTGTIKAVGDQSGGDGSGTIGNLEIGDEVSFANAPADFERVATVSAQLVTAADGESTEDYRQRVLDRAQKTPQGGAYADYEAWATSVAGIPNAYPYTGDPGQVNVYVEATVASSGDPDGIPTTAQLEAVLSFINDDDPVTGTASRRNANAFVNVLPITRTGFDVTVNGITQVDDLAQVQNDIIEAVTDYFLSTEPFIPGLSVLPRNDIITRTKVSSVVEDIITAAGGTFTSAIFAEEGFSGTLTSYVLGEGEKAKASNVSFV